MYHSIQLLATSGNPDKKYQISSVKKFKKSWMCVRCQTSPLCFLISIWQVILWLLHFQLPLSEMMEFQNTNESYSFQNGSLQHQPVPYNLRYNNQVSTSPTQNHFVIQQAFIMHCTHQPNHQHVQRPSSLRLEHRMLPAPRRRRYRRRQQPSISFPTTQNDTRRGRGTRRRHSRQQPY